MNQQWTKIRLGRFKKKFFEYIVPTNLCGVFWVTLMGSDLVQ